MTRPLVRAGVVLVSALLLLSKGAATRDHAVTFDLAQAKAAREALERLPQGVDSFRAGRYAEASRTFEGILARLPETASDTTAAALLHLGEPGHYRALLAGLHGNVGVCRLRQRRFGDAARAFEKAAGIHPRSSRHAANLGVVLLHLHRYSEAQEWLAKAIALGAADAKVYADLARACLKAGNVERARWAARQSLTAAAHRRDLQTWGTAVEVEELLADADLGEGLHSAAEARLRAVLRRAPGQVSARYRLVRLLERAGRGAEAAAERRRFEKDSALAASIQTALSAGTEEGPGLRWAAYSYQRLGLLHLAEVHYVQLLTRDPGDTGSQRALREMRAQAGLGGRQ